MPAIPNLLRRVSSALAITFALAGLVQAQATKSPVVAKSKAKSEKKIDLNKATAEELEELPGVGPVTSKKIIDGRPYKAVSDLEKIGIPAKVIGEITPLVTVGEPAKAEEPKAKTKAEEAKAKGKMEEPKAKAKAEEAKPKAKMEEPNSKLAEAKAKTAEPKEKAAPADNLIDLNKADVETLETLPGIGPVLAKEIIAARPFKSVNDLEKIKGMGEAKFAAIKPKVKVTEAVATKAPEPAKAGESPKMKAAEAKAESKAAETKGAEAKAIAKKEAAKPKGKEVVENEGEVSAKAKKLTDSGKKININTASVETLQELPGIGPVKAKAIVEGRPFKAPEDITNVNGIGDVTFGHLKDFISVK